MEGRKEIIIEEGKKELMSFDEVAKQFDRFIKSRAAAYKEKIEYEEAFQLALIGLWKAFLKYDASTGYTFLTCAFPMVDGAIRGETRKKTAHLTNKCSQVKEFKSFDECVYKGKNGDELKLESILGEEDNNIKDILENDILERMFERLNLKQQTIFKAYLNLGEHNINALAKIFNTSKFKMDKELSHIIDRMRKTYNYEMSM